MLLMEVPVRGPVRSGRLDTSLDRAVEADYLGCLLHRLPSLPARGRVAGFSHMYTVNHDDVHPVVGPSALPGLHLCNGFSGHGFKLAPAVGSLVAPVWPPVGGGSAMGGAEDRKKFLTMVEKACRIGKRLRDLGVRPYGVVRIDSATGVQEWAEHPVANTKKIAETFRAACEIAEAHGERLAAEGEICWGGMQGWKSMIQLLETVGRPKTLGFQADMAHTLLYTMGYNAPEERILPEGYDWKNKEVLQAALKRLTHALRPWTIDFHVAQNDGTVFGSGSHDKTGRHCGCMFPNETMTAQKTWNDILGVMVKVRDAHGWKQ